MLSVSAVRLIESLKQLRDDSNALKGASDISVPSRTNLWLLRVPAFQKAVSSISQSVRSNSVRLATVSSLASPTLLTCAFPSLSPRILLIAVDSAS